MIVADRPCAAAGVFTVNKVIGAPVVVAKRHARLGRAQAIVCNSGIANDATGPLGERNAVETCELVAKHTAILGGDRRLVLPASTGVIGVQLPMEKVRAGVAKLAPRLGRGVKADAAAAKAIMTTDLVPKQALRSLRLGRGAGKRVRIGGICKGSGMIAPNMATMLVFITTDAAISAAMLRVALKRAVGQTFNRMSVDQHTSPSDMVLVLASGAAGNTAINKAGADYDKFEAALTDLCGDLAYQIVQDGEGATRVVRVRVLNAKSQKDADRVGKAVVDSPLVKTAVHGADPNWGRIVTAAGYSGAKVDPDKLTLHIGGGPAKAKFPGAGGGKGVCVFRRGQPAAVNRAGLGRVTRAMKSKEVVLTLDMGLGDAGSEWLGCDLSRQYIAINADYTT